MMNILNNIDLKLNYLKELDNKKFSSESFKNLNKKLETLISQLASEITADKKNILSKEENAIVKKILSKIEMVEIKILPKANLLNSFSKSKI